MSWKDLIDNRYPVSVECRTAFNDVRVTPWRFWDVETSGLNQDTFETIEDAIRVIERQFGPLVKVGFGDNLFAFEMDQNFQIRFITLNTQYIDAEDYDDRLWFEEEKINDDWTDDYWEDNKINHKRESDNPWKTDFEKEL